MNKNQKARFYLRKFLTSLLPVVLPLLILGLVSMAVTANLISQEMTSLTKKQLDVLKLNLEQTMVELDSLNLAFASNSSVISVVDDVLSRKDISFEDIRQVKIVSNFLNAQINGKPYVDSIYLYLNAYPDRFYDSGKGIVEWDNFYDKSWRESYLARKDRDMLWTENRQIFRYDFETTPRTCLTFYRRIFPALNNREGVLVLNLDRAYFDSLLEESSLYRDQSIFLLDRDGRIILSAGDDAARRLAMGGGPPPAGTGKGSYARARGRTATSAIPPPWTPTAGNSCPLFRKKA